MTKQQLINGIAARTGVDKAEAGLVVESFMATIKKSLEAGESVHLRGFGAFKSVKRAPKKARNITAGTTVEIPGRYVPVFVPAAEFARQVQEARVEV